MSQPPPNEENQSLPAFDFDRPSTPTPPPAPAFGQEPIKPQFVKPQKNQKKRTVGCFGILLGFGILIGGCIAFVGLQTNRNIGDVRERSHAFVDAARAGDANQALELSLRGTVDCMSDVEREAIVAQLDGAVERDLGEIDVVSVNGDDSFGWGDVEQLRIDFPDQSVARASVAVVFSNLTSRDVTLILLRPASQWRVCQVTVG